MSQTIKILVSCKGSNTGHDCVELTKGEEYKVSDSLAESLIKADMAEAVQEEAPEEKPKKAKGGKKSVKGAPEDKALKGADEDK